MRILHLLLVLMLFSSCSAFRKAEVVDPQKRDETITLDITQKLRLLSGVKTEKLEVCPSQFANAFVLMVEQPIDHFHPETGKFWQKVYLNHKDENKPMIFSLNGYSVPFNGYISELVPVLDANFIHVEHRYFGDSKPESMDYKYLDIQQSAMDHHRIVQILKRIYKGKWISEGISKGGQTVAFHRRFYPDDVDASIPYVAPINAAREDKRLISFLDQIGSPECRSKVLEYQRAVVSDYDAAFELFQQKSISRSYVFPMGIKRAFELSVMEFEFAYWQWSGGEACDSLPGIGNSTEELVDALFAIDAPSFFNKKDMEYFFPFFYQAYAEIGMYGYCVDSLKTHLREYTSYVDNYNTFIPENINIIYNPSALTEVNEYLSGADRFIFIYGENDAWSATAFVADNVRTNSVTLFQKDGSHMTRIRTLSEDQKKLIYQKLRDWLGVEVHEVL